MDLGLRGQTVLITGASKGIGLACAWGFAAEGCTLHLAARSADKLAEARAAIVARHGVAVHVHPLDLSLESAVEALDAAAGAVDILVNNAGDVPAGRLDALDRDAWQRGFDLKVFGYISLARRAWARMQSRGAGVILNNIGNSGENYDAGYIAGSTANAGLMAFTRALGGISLDRGVRVLGVNPGPVATERMEKLMRRRAHDNFGDESRWQELFARYPAGRAARAEEVADLILFLTSPRAGFISGTIVTIDGGIAARGSIIRNGTA